MGVYLRIYHMVSWAEIKVSLFKARKITSDQMLYIFLQYYICGKEEIYKIAD